jgi:hypothetical protein
MKHLAIRPWQKSARESQPSRTCRRRRSARAVWHGLVTAASAEGQSSRTSRVRMLVRDARYDRGKSLINRGVNRFDATESNQFGAMNCLSYVESRLDFTQPHRTFNPSPPFTRLPCQGQSLMTVR